MIKEGIWCTGKEDETTERENYGYLRDYPFPCGFYKLYMTIETKIIIPSGTQSMIFKNGEGQGI